MITSGSATATSAGGTTIAAAAFIRVPPGPCTVLLANAGTSATVYVGAGTSTSAGGGFPVASGAVAPVVIPVYAGSPSSTWSAVTASGTATVAWIISDPSGGTGI